MVRHEEGATGEGDVVETLPLHAEPLVVVETPQPPRPHPRPLRPAPLVDVGSPRRVPLEGRDRRGRREVDNLGRPASPAERSRRALREGGPPLGPGRRGSSVRRSSGASSSLPSLLGTLPDRGATRRSYWGGRCSQRISACPGPFEVNRPTCGALHARALTAGWWPCPGPMAQAERPRAPDLGLRPADGHETDPVHRVEPDVGAGLGGLDNRLGPVGARPDVHRHVGDRNPPSLAKW